MKKKTKIIIGVSAGVLLLAGVGIYFYKKKQKNQGALGGNQKSAGGDSEYEFGMDSGGGSAVDERYTTPINPKLSGLDNEDVASYLSKILSESEIDSFRGWLRLIEKEHRKDPSKWGDANGLTGQTSRVAHALYQMRKSGDCSDCWNPTHLTAFLDA